MKLIQLLEETYNIESITEKIFNDHIAHYHHRARTEEEAFALTKKPIERNDIKKYFKDMQFMKSIGKNKINLSTKVMNYGRNPDVVWGDEGEINIRMYILPHKLVDDFKYFKKEIIQALIHEITHVIDVVRSKMKPGEPRKKGTKPTNIRYRYQTDPMELNATIHELEQVRRKNLKKWNNIERAEDLFKVMDTIGVSGWRMMDANQRKQFIKKLVHRLSREKLLPKKMATL